MNSIKDRPSGKKWLKAELWYLKLWDKRWPVCGYRLCWVVKGYKRVSLSTGIMQTKINMRMQDWDNIGVKERYNTAEDRRVFNEKRARIWEESRIARIQVEAEMAEERRTGVRKKRKRRRRTKAQMAEANL